MILWFAGASVALVWQVLRDPAVDYRLVMLGALLPDAMDAPFGGGRVMHSVTASAALLAVVMVATRGRRRLRRRLLAVPMGTFVHLLLDGAWTRAHLFWWPFLGRSLRGQRLPAIDHGWPVVVVEELAGVAALVWFWQRFRLADRDRRADFVRTGRLGRDA